MSAGAEQNKVAGGGLDSELRRRIEAFLVEHYEGDDLAGEPVDELASESVGKLAEEPAEALAEEPADKLRSPINYSAKPSKQSSFETPAFGAAARSAAPAEPPGMVACDQSVANVGDLGLWLDQIDEPFSTTLLALIDRKGLSDVEVYKRANMSRQLFSRIRGDASYRPAKKTVLALAIAMKLSLPEMRDLLERAGFALSRSSKRDIIVEYFVTNGIFDLFAINEALYEFDEPLI